MGVSPITQLGWIDPLTLAKTIDEACWVLLYSGAQANYSRPLQLPSPATSLSVPKARIFPRWNRQWTANRVGTTHGSVISAMG